MFATLAILAVSGAVQYIDELEQVIVLNPKSYPLVGDYWIVDLDIPSGGNLTIAAVDGTYFGDDIGFARMYDQGGADVQPSYQDDSTVRFDDIAAGSWHFEVAVYTAGRHDMMFELDGSTARASNNALIPGAFVTTWQTTSANEAITIPISGYPGSYTVAWGDGNVTTHTNHATHTYAAAGNHTVSISGDYLTMHLSIDISNAAKLVSIDQWGGAQWESMSRAFYRASNMIYNAADVPDLSEVTDMSFMFGSTPLFDGDLSGWDVSDVTDMSGMFWEASSFNGNISTWDVSSVTDMYSMFNGAAKFNGDLSEWDVSGVTNMRSTFARALVFDSDLSEWDVSGVKKMNGMFKSAEVFNSDISDWDVSGVTNMERLFSFAYNFDGDISGWDVSGVTDMEGMFNHADSFNGNISGWDVSGVTNMRQMFWENQVFNADISGWDVSSVTDMEGMFNHANSFNGDISGWDVSGVTDMGGMFDITPVFNGDISGWDVSGVTDMGGMFNSAQNFNADISGWDVSGVTDMGGMFDNAQNFNADISGWDVSGVTDMENMFRSAFDFEQNLGNWYVVLNNTSVSIDDVPGIVGTISAQNPYLGGQNITYEIGTGGDFDSFSIVDGSGLNMTVSPDKSTYTVNITSTGSFGTSNHRVYTITVPASPTNPVPAASFGAGDNAFANLESPYYITTVKIGTGTYALVTSSGGTGGVQIIDITDPANPVPAASFDDNDTVTVDGVSKAFDELQGARGIATTMIGTGTYAAVAAFKDHGVQIVNITDPANPVPTASFGDNDTVTVGGTNKTFDKLEGAFDIATATIGSGTYALVTAYEDNGVQIIDITDPANPVPTASFGNKDTVMVGGTNKTFDKLKGGEGIATVAIGTGTYALVAAYYGHGVQIIDITDPANPVPVASFGDGDRVDGVSKAFDELKGANGITTVTIGTGTYALVTAYDDDGVQIVNITDPANPVPVASFDDGDTVMVNGAGKTFGRLNGAFGITTATIGAGTYALVAAIHDNGVQIIDITDPANPVPAASFGKGDSFDGKTFGEFNTPRGIATATINANAYALVAIYLDDDVQIIDLGETPDTTIPPPDGSFVTTWQTTSADETVTIPVNNAMGTYTVYWGDGSATTYIGDATHTYAAAGSYTVSISGDFTRIYLAGDSTNAKKLASIDQWGDVRWESMNGAFYGAPNMAYNTTDAPDLSDVTDMSGMFNSASSFDGDISAWDVSDVTDMSGMFNSASSFDGDISAWDVSDVTDMSGMFNSASSFDGDISAWDVSDVTDMSGMFNSASSFDGDISAWDVSDVTDMSGMFNSASSFDGDISAWDVSDVTDMSGMFNSTSSFDGDISAWDVSDVTDMSGMFNGAAFNQNISGWNVSSVSDMSGMFNGAAFNQNISGWNVSSVSDMSGMFNGAAFNQNISGWNVSSVSDMSGMFNSASAFGQNLGNWYVVLDNTVINAGDAPGMVGAISAQNQYLDNQNPTYGIGTGGDADSFEITGRFGLNMTVAPTKSIYVVNITSAGSFGASNHRVYNVTVTDMDTTAPPSDGSFVTTWKTTSADEAITIPVGSVAGNYTVRWGDGSTTTHVGDATHTYTLAGNHTVSISGNFTRIHLANDSDNAAKLVSIDQWGGMRWESMHGAFRGALNMIYNTTDVPDLSIVRDMSSMFYNAASFDGDLSSWDVSSVTDMHDMFQGAASFDGDISTWDVSSVTNMYGMFRGAASFDGDISTWDVSSVTNMYGMFRGAASFDGDLPSWNVSSVTDMHSMFYGASAFDGDISTWNVSSVTGMFNMFSGASAFKQNLGNWYIVLDNTVINAGDAPGIVGTISAQNQYLDNQNPTYGIGTGGDAGSFEITGNRLSMTSADSGQDPYTVNVTASGGSVFEEGNNWRIVEITVTITDSIPPVVADAPRSIGSVTLASTVPGVVEASWDAPAEEPGDYRIAWAKVGDGFRTWADLTVNAFPTTTSHTITDLEEGAEYKMKVRARYDGGSGDWSDQHTVTVKASVQDTADPTITITGANPISVTTGTTYSDPGATCTDDTDASPTLATTSNVDAQTAGTYQVTYTCTDSSSNTATATRDVVVADAPDTADPTITITGANPISVTTGTTYSDPGATCTDDTDASPTLTTTSNVDAQTAGTYQVTYTCTDSSSNTATATRDVVVADAPRSIGSVTLASTVPGVVEASWDAPAEEPGDYRIAWAKVGDGFRTWADLTVNAFPTTTSHTITDLEEGAEYKMKVRARYDGGSGDWSDQHTVTVKASVQDTADPTITITGANPISVTTGTTYSDPGATCTDDTDASPTLATTSGVDAQTAGTYQVTYTCTDSSSNTATATRDVVVADAPDTADPTITITGANPISVTTGTTYSDPGATCTDDTDASPTLATTSNVDAQTAGTYQVTYTCTDSSSNTATATRDVVVADAPDTADPTITITGANPISVTTGTTYSDPGATCTDDTDASPTLATTSNVDAQTAGTYQVTYTCTDSSSNTATATRDVVVADAPRSIGSVTLASTVPGVVEASWDAPAEEPGDYRIAWAKVGDGFRTWADLTVNAFPTTTSHTITDLEEGAEYKMKVRARYDGGSGDWSDQHTVTVKASVQDTADPTITITGANPISVTTGTTYSDPGATCTDDTDASPTLATTSNVDAQTAGTYQVTYTCTDSSSNTATATRDVVVADAPDSTAPTVSSIERHIPTDQNTGSQTLVYQVTFSEDVTGVDAGDFVLSPGSPVAGGASGQFAQTSEPAIPIPDRSTVQDAITVEQSGTATSVSVAVDVTHSYIGDLVIDLIAPDGTTRTLHDRTGYETDDIDRTYAPDFGGVGIAGDWILRVRDSAGGDTGTLNGWTLTINHGSAASPVTAVSGSGDTYQVTVPATQDGTYNLDLASSGHGIVDEAGNPLADTTPTGADHTYIVGTAVV